ncbi:MAG: AAA family ATPase [Chloroflexi bacterium]|nr:AAA family ATPase [Chloroflexota bacterium]
MTTLQALTPDELFHQCDPDEFAFQTTADLEELQEIIGQERAIEAIRVGVGIEHEGYNLFALGPNGTGKHTAVHQYLSQKAIQEPTPDDWCYVYNFEQARQPQALRLPAGRGILLAKEMEQLVEDLFTVLRAAFSGDDYNNKKNELLKKLKERENKALEELQEKAKAANLALLRTPQGVGFAPLDEKGNVLTPDQFMHLPPAQQAEMEKRVAEMQALLQEVMRQVPQWHREVQNEIKKLNQDTAVIAITPLFSELQHKYQDLADVLTYLEAVQADIVENVMNLLEAGDTAISEITDSAGTSTSEIPQQFGMTRYKVNVLVDNSQLEGAPIVYEDQATYNNLIGRIEHISQMGTLITDFTLVQPGVLHRANGGYLILDARKLLLQPFAWDGLKRALRAQEIRIESLGHMYSWISSVSLEPEPIPLNIKVVLLGDRLLYYLLCHYDPDFGELFKISADFEDDMPRSPENDLAYARLVTGLVRKEELRHFDRTAVARVIEHSARIAGDAEKLTTHMQTISDVLREANYWAGEAGHEFVTAVDVQKALDAQEYRAGRIRERILEAMMQRTLLIDSEGAVTGQINGLAVYDLGNIAFGRPNRITARIRLGKGEVIDIERQVEMGGPIHSKGVMILTGFLGARYAGERPFSLSATLVFEQSYNEVDGDSASLAELAALMSALADAPIKQSLAVTGSVNQKGQVQAIGGVNEKIEGFFELCQTRGLAGEQGVLIPAANVRHLMLKPAVVQAVRDGQFHIYPIETVDEAMELLSGMTTDEVDGRIITRLEKMAETVKAFTAVAAENGQRQTKSPV